MDFSTLAKHSQNGSEHSASGPSIVTGSRGQDGSYLRDLIGYDKSIGCINPSSNSRGALLANEFSIDLGDRNSVLELLRITRPKSIFHLAARHGPSTKMTFEKEDIEAMQRLHVEATRNFLEAIESLGLDTHLVVAGSSRIFSPTEEITKISEDTPPNPKDFYGESKLAAWNLVKKSRDEFGTKASFLILFNHESPRRPKGYLSQDIALAIHAYLLGVSPEIRVRDTSFLGDWSDARDVVALMHSHAQARQAEDLVVGSGNLQTVGSIVEKTLTLLGRESAPISSSLDLAASEARAFLVAANLKSIELGLWRPKSSIEEAVFEIVQAKAE
jgi:GDPmannose 4,6-dehydratase